jgi:hypothetical protein
LREMFDKRRRLHIGLANEYKGQWGLGYMDWWIDCLYLSLGATLSLESFCYCVNPDQSFLQHVRTRPERLGRGIKIYLMLNKKNLQIEESKF